MMALCFWNCSSPEPYGSGGGATGTQLGAVETVNASLVDLYDRAALKGATEPGFIGLSGDVTAEFLTRGVNPREPLVVTSPSGIPVLLAGLDASFPPLTQPVKDLAPPGLLQQFLNSYGNLFAPTGRQIEFTVQREDVFADGTTVLRVQQVIDGVRIQGADAVAHLRPNGDLSYFHGRLAAVPAKLPLPDYGIDKTVALTFLPTGAGVQVEAIDPSLVWIPEALGSSSEGDELTLAWEVLTRDAHDTLVVTRISAADGTVLASTPVAKHAMARSVSDAEGLDTLPGVLRFTDDPYYCNGCVDTVVRAARSYLATLYSFWNGQFGWSSYDGSDAVMEVTVRYGGNTTSPFWDGYNNDKGTPFSGMSRAVFDPGNVSMDFVAHEFGHAMNQATAGLDHMGHSGALDEHASDCLAAVVSQDWILFEGTSWSATYLGTRNVAHPQLSALAWDTCANCSFTGQPDRWTRFGTNSKDDKLVHYNAGIGNKVCYLLAAGSLDFNGLSVAGQGFGRTAETFHNLLRYYLTSTSTYEDYVVALSAAALKVDIDNGLVGFPTTLASLDALAAVGLWDPPQAVPTSTLAVDRVATTDHATPNNGQGLLVAFRSLPPRRLTFAEYGAATGWLPAYTSAYEVRPLLGAPDFLSERDSLALDWIFYPVEVSPGIRAVVRAALINGALAIPTPVTPYLPLATSNEPVTAAALAGEMYVFHRDVLKQVHWAQVGGSDGIVTVAGQYVTSAAPPDVVESLGRIWLAYTLGNESCVISATPAGIHFNSWSNPYCPRLSADAFNARFASPPGSVRPSTLIQWDVSGNYNNPAAIRLLLSSHVQDPNYLSYPMAQISLTEDGNGTVVAAERNVLQPIEGVESPGKSAAVGGRLHQVFIRSDGTIHHRKKRGY